MKKITEPNHLEYAMYYENYIKKVDKTVSVLDQLKSNAKSTVELIKSLNETQLTYSYAEGKWSIKDIIQHLIDCERVFIYRAMRFARNDKSPLPFFDEDAFAKEANADKLTTSKLLKEFTTTRNATIAFFNNQSASVMKRIGIASNYNMSVRACAWIICGHEIHHMGVIKERYLLNKI
jgi:uncharacterized damage-inducible protein DinB